MINYNRKVILSTIILSNTLDDEIYTINRNCIQSLRDSENWDELGGIEIILIESNKEADYTYDARVQIITPDEPFNFNRFFNRGIAKSNGQFIALCNNDIVFSENWFTEILKVKSIRKDILCFSPIDRDYKTMSYDLFPDNKLFYVGWKNKYHFSAWCHVVDKQIFKIIGKLDETFDFYSADDDFLMTLRKNVIPNALVTKSHVKHLSEQVIKKLNQIKSPNINDIEHYPIPGKYLKRGYTWLWDDFRFYDAFIKMDRKWGDNKMTRRTNRLLNLLPFLRIRPVTKILYSKQANLILSKITGL